MVVNFEPLFEPYAEAAISRLRYVHPALHFDLLSPTSVEVTGVQPDAETTMRREITYQLYREKIYQEGLPMRGTMYSALFG